MRKLFTLTVAALSTIASWAQPSPYKGVAADAIQDGTSYYLYNVDFGQWLGDNNRNTAFGWTSHAEISRVGRDIKFILKEGGWQLDPKLGNNHSINGDNLYMDTGNGWTKWNINAIEGSVSNAVSITCDGHGLAVNDAGDMDNNADGGTRHNVWQIVTREERLQYAVNNGTEDNPVDISGLVLGGTFPIACDHREKGTWQGEKGSNASGGDGFYHCNRVWELWGITNRDVYQDIVVPNGKYIVKARAIYVSTGNDGQNADRYNEYVADPEGNTKGVIYANEQSSPMHNVYEYASDERVNDHFTRDLGNGKWTMNGTNEFSTNMFEGKGEIEPIEVVVTTGSLRIGFKVEGANSAWMLINNIDLFYAGQVQDLTPYKEALNNAISEAEAYTGMTTDVLRMQLMTALSNARDLTESTDADAISEASGALVAALNKAKEVDVKVLVATVALARTEGIDMSDMEAYLYSGTTNEVEQRLRLVRNLRKLNAIEKVNISMIDCSEPTAEEADYYLYNVGAGIFFSTTADWGTHIALDNPGMLIHFRPDGEWNGAPGRPVFHLSGNGWDGMNWGEEYWDKNGENKLAFVPVEGKDKVYYMCEWDAYNWHFVYDPAEDVCDGNTHYWNAVQKRNWNVDDYKDNPYAQWMLVSPEAYKAAKKKATMAEHLDMTFMIENPNFTKARVDGHDNWDRGWTGVGGQMRGEGREPWQVIEWFERSADMKQTIKGLPVGKYRVTAYGFFRDGNSDHEAQLVLNGETPRQEAKVYAINGDGDKSDRLLPNVTSEAGNFPGVGESHGLSGDFACWPWQANQYFQAGLYKATTDIITVGEDGELTIGIEYDHTTGADGSWVVVGNFRLECVEGFANFAPETFKIRYNGHWDGEEMAVADDSNDITKHFHYEGWLGTNRNEGLFINFKDGEDNFYCPSDYEDYGINLHVAETGVEFEDLTNTGSDEMAGYAFKTKTNLVAVDVYFKYDGSMKVVCSDKGADLCGDALYIAAEQKNGWSRNSDECYVLPKVADGVYEGTITALRENEYYDVARIFTKANNGDDDNYIGFSGLVYAADSTYKLSYRPNSDFRIRKGEQTVTVNLNEGTVTFKYLGEPSYMYAVGTLVDASWQNNNHDAYKLVETEAGSLIFRGVVKIAEDGDSRFTLFEERSSNGWNQGRWYPGGDPKNITKGEWYTNNKRWGDDSWRIPAGTYMVTMDVANQRILCTDVHTQEVVVGSAGFATFVAEYPYTEIPADAEIKAAQNMETYVHLEPMTQIPAGEAVVIKAPAGVYTFTEGGVAKSDVLNDLVASTTDTEAQGAEYILANGPEGVGFYQATPGTSIKAGKAYIVMTLQAKTFYGFEADDETAISGIEADSKNAAIYNIAGQRISKAQKGINIINGKKVIK